jgi:hypothetical protein
LRAPDHVSAAQPVKVNVLDILVDQCHLVVLWNKRREQSKAGDWQVGPFAEQLHAVLQPPK